jgi:hypothetical protein
MEWNNLSSRPWTMGKGGARDLCTIFLPFPETPNFAGIISRSSRSRSLTRGIEPDIWLWSEGPSDFRRRLLAEREDGQGFRSDVTASLWASPEGSPRRQAVLIPVDHRQAGGAAGFDPRHE